MAPRRPRPLLARLIFLVILLTLIGVNWTLFRLFAHQNYFLWYLKNGALVSLATGFLAPTWTHMKARIGLISSDPVAYGAACQQILGVFMYSLAPSASSQKTQPKALDFDIGLNLWLATIFDDLVYWLLIVVMLLLTLLWTLIVAPLAYFVTLIAGVPARQALRGKIATTHLQEEEGNVQIIESDAEAKPAESSDLSFARDPFAITQAVTALVLWSANIVYSRVG